MKNQKLVWMVMPPPEDGNLNELSFVKNEVTLGERICPKTTLEKRGPKLTVAKAMNDEPLIGKYELKLPEIITIEVAQSVERRQLPKHRSKLRKIRHSVANLVVSTHRMGTPEGLSVDKDCLNVQLKRD